MQVFGQRILERLWSEEGDDDDAFRRAFLRWADAISERYDAAVALPPVLPHTRASVVGSSTRAACKEMHGGGVSFRDLAKLHELTLRQVVTAVYAGCDGRRFAAYVALEETLLAEGAPSHWGDMNRKHGFGESTRVAQRLAEKHGLPKTLAQLGGRRAA